MAEGDVLPLVVGVVVVPVSSSQHPLTYITQLTLTNVSLCSQVVDLVVVSFRLVWTIPSIPVSTVIPYKYHTSVLAVPDLFQYLYLNWGRMALSVAIVGLPFTSLPYKTFIYIF